MKLLSSISTKDWVEQKQEDGWTATRKTKYILKNKYPQELLIDWMSDSSGISFKPEDIVTTNTNWYLEGVKNTVSHSEFVGSYGVYIGELLIGKVHVAMAYKQIMEE